MAAKKFKFRLDPLLKLRKHREKERQKEHAAAAAEAHKQKQLNGDIDRARVNTLDYQRSRLAGQLSVPEALICSRYIMKLKRQRLAGNELLHALQKETEKKRTKLVEAARDRKIFEKLKEKQQLRHRREIEKQEQKELDEVAAGPFQRAPGLTRIRRQNQP